MCEAYDCVLNSDDTEWRVYFVCPVLHCRICWNRKTRKEKRKVRFTVQCFYIGETMCSIILITLC